jgi:prepilin-type N-terminal cleavage/methylation domain-containing protein
MKTKMSKGFTLFELLVSISIIAILVALASTSFSGAQKKARDSRRMEDMEMVRKAAEQYYMLNSSSYPVVWSSGTAWVAPGSQTVLQAFPSDPKPAPYTQYSYTGGSTSAYCLCALLENTTAGNSDGVCGYATGTKTHYCVSNQQ